MTATTGVRANRPHNFYSLVDCPTQILYPVHRIDDPVGQTLGLLAVAEDRDELQDRLVLAWDVS